jgi:hypothetical protein
MAQVKCIFCATPKQLSDIDDDDVVEALSGGKTLLKRNQICERDSCDQISEIESAELEELRLTSSFH